MRAPGLETAFTEFISRHRLLASVDRLIVAVSGGIDSMVMLHLLVREAPEHRITLEIAHVNHGLRGPESEGDEEFVRHTAGTLGLPCRVHRALPDSAQDTPGSSLQERARRERYHFFESLLGDSPASRVATAHNRNDNVETVLFNFLRGSGVRGLTGIPVVRADGHVIRPLLFASREEVREYAASHGIAHREDSSNVTVRYTRNVLRHVLIPEIESSVNPGLKNTLIRTTEFFGELDSYLRAEVERVLPAIVRDSGSSRTVLDVHRLAALHRFLCETVLHHFSKRFIPRGVPYAQIRTLMKLLAAPSGSSCRVAGNFHAFRDRDTLTLLIGEPPAPFLFPVTLHDSYEFGDFSFSSGPADRANPGGSPFEEYVDAGLLGTRIVLRSWSEGDWFMPIGQEAKRKKVSDFFIDRKVPVTEKQRIPLLVSDDAIVWICGYRLDDRFKVTPRTSSILKLSYSPAVS